VGDGEFTAEDCEGRSYVRCASPSGRCEAAVEALASQVIDGPEPGYAADDRDLAQGNRLALLQLGRHVTPRAQQATHTEPYAQVWRTAPCRWAVMAGARQRPAEATSAGCNTTEPRTKA
jgi:hypothetical protein